MERVEKRAEDNNNINFATDSLSYYIFLMRYKIIFAFSIIYQRSDGAIILSVTGSCSFIYISNFVLPDVLATSESD